MKFVALISGGKDSIYSIQECIKNGHILLGCIHMGAPIETTEESYMYQSAASEVVSTLVKECLQVPFYLHRRVGKSINTTMVYDDNNNDNNNTTATTQSNHENNNDYQQQQQQKQQHYDEVEDLFVAIQTAKQTMFPDMQAISSGAILSNYQRIRIESVCHRLQLTSLSFLWRQRSQQEMLQSMIFDNNIHAIVVRAACPPGLLPHRHLNKSIQQLYPLFQKWHSQYQFHMCGEGGEYESLVIDCPLYKKRLIIDESFIQFDNDGNGPNEEIGNLVITKCHAEEKEQTQESENIVINDNNIDSNITTTEPSQQEQQHQSIEQSKSTMEKNSISVPPPITIISHFPYVKQLSGGLLYISEIMTPTSSSSFPNNSNNNNNDNEISESDLALQEAISVISILKETLKYYNATPQDVIFVHLYLSQISHFAKINKYYQQCFGTTLPPSRSCVAIGSKTTHSRRVVLDCMVQLGSGAYMRHSDGAATSSKTATCNPYTTAALQSSTFATLRKVLHVQSISYWAPICVGPYSQCNTLRSGLHFLAGQIGLIPQTMTLQPTWIQQLHQCWKNIAAVLDALDGTALCRQQQNDESNDDNNGHHLVSGLIYVQDSIYHTTNSLQQIQSISYNQIQSNGGIIPGQIDGTVPAEELYGGYEDEGTWLEMQKLQIMENSNNSTVFDTVPLLVVSIPEMPVGALIEVEVITTSKQASTLPLKTSYLSHDNVQMPLPCNTNLKAPIVGWDTGHDFPTTTETQEQSSMILNSVHVTSFARVLGNGCCAAAIITAQQVQAEQHQQAQQEIIVAKSTPVLKIIIQYEWLFQEMFSCLDQLLSHARSGLVPSQVAHIRLYYLANYYDKDTDRNIQPLHDGIQLRGCLQAALAKRYKKDDDTSPAFTLVPVQGMSVISSSSPSSSNSEQNDNPIFIAMQVLLLDPVHLETEMWIHQHRENV